MTSSSLSTQSLNGPNRRLVGGGIVPLLMAISFVCYVNRVCIATAGDTRIMAQYAISPERMGEVYSAFLLTYTLGMIPGGLLIDRIGPRAALMTVLVGSSVFVALTGVIGLTISGGVTAFLTLLVVRGLMGWFPPLFIPHARRPSAAGCQHPAVLVPTGW